jgi:hypothetical protein
MGACISRALFHHSSNKCEGGPSMLGDYDWAYSPLAKWGNWIWAKLVDPPLCVLAGDLSSVLRRLRGLVQVIVLVAILLIPVSLFYKTGHVLTASGLLFDIAGVLRLFLLEEVDDALEHYRDKGRIPSWAMRELIMPEAAGPYDYGEDAPHIKRFYYKKRGVLFLFVGFVLQMLGDILG